MCLKECVGIADSLYNLRLIRTFCERQLALRCFHFTYEDLLYGRDNLHDNVLVFLAELFYLLEAAQQQGDSSKDAATEGLLGGVVFGGVGVFFGGLGCLWKVCWVGCFWWGGVLGRVGVFFGWELGCFWGGEGTHRSMGWGGFLGGVEGAHRSVG